MPNLNLSLPNIQDTLKAEAAPVVLELACRIIIARTNAARPTDESMAAKSIRGMMRGDFQARLAAALQDEEKHVLAVQNALTKAQGAALDGIGGTMGTPRVEGETDADYRARLEGANDLEAKPVRSSLRSAAEALADTLLENPGPVVDLLNATANVMANT
jgi:hypothetical protein